MVFPLIGRFAAVVRALNTTCLSCLLSGKRGCGGIVDLQAMNDDQKRDIGLLDGRATYRISHSGHLNAKYDRFEL